MTEYDIRMKIADIQVKLMELRSKKTYEYNEVKGLDVYGRQETRTVGSKEEIKRLEEELKRLENELERRKEAELRKSKEDLEAKKLVDERERKKLEQEKAQKEADEFIRKSDFKEIKELYKKSTSSFDRFCSLINGKHPNWKKISKYSLQQLEHILKVRTGGTIKQKRYDKEREKGLKDETPEELRDRLNYYHRRDFNNILVSEAALNSSMKDEEDNKRRGRR